MLYVGLDVSARRGLDVAVLDDERRCVGLWRTGSTTGLSAGLATLRQPFVVAVDAPQARSDFPIRRPEVRAALPVPPPEGRFRRYRICDYEVARRGMPLYLLPEPGMSAPRWMRVGFALFRRLQEKHGLRLPVDADDHAATLLEVYPYASFVTLLGRRPPRKTTAAGAALRIGALRAAGLGDLPPRQLSHDEADALCAAHSAWAWRHGRGCALGLPGEGFIVLPVTRELLKDRYHVYPDC